MTDAKLSSLLEKGLWHRVVGKTSRSKNHLKRKRAENVLTPLHFLSFCIASEKQNCCEFHSRPHAHTVTHTHSHSLITTIYESKDKIDGNESTKRRFDLKSSHLVVVVVVVVWDCCVCLSTFTSFPLGVQHFHE